MKKADHIFSPEDHTYMQIALNLATRGLGRVAPNPAVGCVLVKDGHIIGRGWTAPNGRPHAETVALNQAENANGATAYVTLEPCAHHGKTPPCADALVNAGVAKVIIATADPDPRVNGAGVKILQDAGIDVQIGLMKEEADQVNQGFFNTVIRKRPLVTVKIASSKDGKIAEDEGKQTWITGKAARKRGHLYRASHDAIMVGIGTACVDDPTLDCRITGLEDRSPVRVLIDTHLKIDEQSKLCKSAQDIPLWIMTASTDVDKTQRMMDQGAKVFNIDVNADGGLNLHDVMKTLAENGITRLLSEGGGKLNASLIRSGLIDRLLWFKSNNSVGETGVDALYDMPIEKLDQFLSLSVLDEGFVESDHWQECKVTAG